MDVTRIPLRQSTIKSTRNDKTLFSSTPAPKTRFSISLTFNLIEFTVQGRRAEVIVRILSTLRGWYIP